MKVQGYARRNRGTGGLCWAHVAKLFPSHAEHIFRIRNNQKKLDKLYRRLSGGK